MSNWNHSICAGCWIEKNGDRIPHRLKRHPDNPPEPRQCCFCGCYTFSGILVRHEPNTFGCNVKHGLVREITAQTDPFLIEWLLEAGTHGGDFLQSLADAALRADSENYPPLRPILLFMKNKYPKYDLEPE